MSEETPMGGTAADIQFSPKKTVQAYETFKTIQNRLRELRPEEVVHHCIRQLNPGRSFTYEELVRSPPWLYLIIIKWVVLYGDFLAPDRRVLRDRDMEEILIAMVRDLWGAVRHPNDYDNHYLFMRASFQQQIWLQENFLTAEIGRQSIFFHSLQPSHSFRRKFREASGIDLDVFLELGLALASRFIVNNAARSVREEFFKNLDTAYPPGTITSFLSLLSRDFQSLRTYLGSINPGRSVLYEFVEPTPLTRFPLLRDNGQYYCYQVHLLFRSLQSFVFSTLRQADANGFITQFGPIFEQYLARGLSHASVSYITESELANRLPKDSQLVDYAVLTTEGVILIDAKAVEPTDLGMIAHKAEVVADKVKPVFKAIGQGFEVTYQLRAQGLADGSAPVFLLVVTHSDMLLGTGPDFCKYVGQRRIAKLAETYGGTFPIPMEHIFFLSVNDFDLLMEHIRSAGIRLLDFLSFAAKGDCIVFRQLIPGAIGSTSFPQYLITEFEVLGERLRALLRKTEINNHGNV